MSVGSFRNTAVKCNRLTCKFYILRTILFEDCPRFASSHKIWINAEISCLNLSNMLWICKAIVKKTVSVKNCFKTNHQSNETIIQFQKSMFAEVTNTNNTDTSEKTQHRLMSINLLPTFTIEKHIFTIWEHFTFYLRCGL